VIDHREEALARTMELLNFFQQAGTLLMQASVLYRCGRVGRQQNGDMLVLVGECLSTQLLSEIEIPEDAAFADDRNSEK